MTTYTQLRRPLKLVTPLGPDYLLATRLDAREYMSRLFQFDVSAIVERSKTLPFEKLLGQSLQLAVATPGSQPRFFHGLCNEIMQGNTDREWTHYTLKVVPHVWLLTKKTECRIFQRQTVPDILRAVFTGFDVAFELQGNFPPREYCVQYRETDFDFASRLMEEEGIFYFFKHTKDGHKLVLANHPGCHPELPQGSIRVKNGVDPIQTDHEVIYDLGKRQRMVSSKVTLWDHHFQIPHRNLEAQALVPDEIKMGSVKHKLIVGEAKKLELFDFPGEYAQRFDGISPCITEQPDRLQQVFTENNRTARLRIEEEAAKALHLMGASNVSNLTPGYRATLAAGDTMSAQMYMDGQYLLTSVRHVVEDAGNFRSGEGEYRYQNSFEAIPAALTYRPERQTEKPLISGTQTAVVTGPAGEEIYTDKFGRVKVKFHWDRYGKNDANSSCWLRVATPHAGKGWGSVCIPRVGEEVIVDFLEGDPDRPIIVGRVYNPTEMPPYTLPDKRMVSGMRSKTYPGGGGFNEISMDDSKGNERMFIHAQYNQDTVVGNNRTAKVGVDDSEEVGNNQTIKIGNDQTETISNNQNTSVGQNIVIEAGTSITLRCGASMIHMNQAGVITISGTLVSMVGSINTNVSAPITTITGSMLLNSFGAVNVSTGVLNHVEGTSRGHFAGGIAELKATGDCLVQGSMVKIN